jgi:hypothetical protein
VVIVWAAVALRPDTRGSTILADRTSELPAAVEEGENQAVAEQPDGADRTLAAADVASAETSGGGPGAADAAIGGDTEESSAADDAGGREARGSDEDEELRPEHRREPDEAHRAPAETPATETADAGGAAASVERRAAPFEREILELEIVSSERCWIRVKADGVVVADTTVEAGERLGWRADGLFELDVGAGDAVTLYLNDELLGPAGSDRRVVEGLRVTKDGMLGL